MTRMHDPVRADPLEDVDLVVIGGGCAGLALASRLAEGGAAAPRTLVLDARTRYGEDRTWCFWRVEETGFDACIAAAWESARVAGGGREALLDCRRYPYVMIPAGRFYAQALAAIDASSRVARRTGIRVADVVREADGRLRVETSAGPVRARRVVDTRPAPIAEGGALLWQSFLGREVETQSDAFNPTCVDLMAFDPPSRTRIGFTYVLPLGPRRALIEYTVLARAPLAPAELAADLARVEAARIGARPSRVIRTEHGRLPMGLLARPERLAPGHVRAGLAGGAARPSSGYAFLRIQRWARDCAARLLADGDPGGADLRAPQPDPATTRVMDRVFLRVLARAPERAPEMFCAMIAGTPPDRLIRFLSDRGSLRDHLALALALPVLPFAREAPGSALEEIGLLPALPPLPRGRESP